MLYFEFMKKAFQERYSYRLDFFLSILASLFALFIQINVWTALFATEGSAKVVSLSEMLSYMIIASVIMTLIRSKVSDNISEGIQTGNILSHFIKPINFRNYLFAEDMGRNLFQVLFINLPICILLAFTYGFVLQQDIWIWLVFIPALVLGIGIAFYINYIIGLMAFWLETAWYLPFFVSALFGLFSGAVVPLWYYPSWLFEMCNWLPFRFVFYEPISVYLKRYTLGDSLTILAIEAIWLVVLIMAERLIWSRVKHRMSAFGG